MLQTLRSAKNIAQEELIKMKEFITTKKRHDKNLSTPRAYTTTGESPPPDRQ